MIPLVPALLSSRRAGCVSRLIRGQGWPLSTGYQVRVRAERLREHDPGVAPGD